MHLKVKANNVCLREKERERESVCMIVCVCVFVCAFVCVCVCMKDKRVESIICSWEILNNEPL